MTGSRSLARLLERHKLVLSREFDNPSVLQRLVEGGVLSADEEQAIRRAEAGGAKGDLLVKVFAEKGFNAFRQLCVTLEMECPQLLTSLLLDSSSRTNNTGAAGGGPNNNDLHSRESSIVSSILAMSPKCDNRELEMNRSPSAGSLSSPAATALYSLPGASASALTSASAAETLARNDKEKALLESMHELLEEPVEEMSGERIAWEYHHVQLTRVPGYGFGIAVSGGRDNPHFTNGDPSIAISDVLKAGPAEAKLLINDRVISANNISLEGVDYATAVQVLRDSGQTVNLMVKRRVVMPAPSAAPAAAAAPMTSLGTPPVTKASAVPDLRVSLTRNKKKEDFGLVLGCKIYVKEVVSRTVADKDGSVRQGDLVHKINGSLVDGLTLKEARKLIETAKDRLDLVVRKEHASEQTAATATKQMNGYAATGKGHADDLKAPFQKLYVSPPPEPPEKNNLARLAGGIYSTGAVVGASDAPPRPPLPPAEEDDYGTSQQRRSESYSDGKLGQFPDPRFISFKKAGSVGIRLTGGNDVGIFVTAVQNGSPAAQQGLQPGDKILKVNDMDMKGVTREEAVLFLLSLQDQINLIAQYRREEYEQIVALQRGDSFYIKAHFNFDTPQPHEMSFGKSDVFHVVDTLHNGVVGSWQVFRMDPFLSGLGRAAEQVQKGIIPNKAGAEEIATKQFNAAKKEHSNTATNNDSGKSSSSFFRRRRDKNHRRSKSLGKDHWEDLVWSESMSKFPAYERVSLRHPGFPRPVVIFGPVADVARERLLGDYPGKFASPQQDNSRSSDDSKSVGSKSGIVRLSSIRQIMDRGRHALLDVTPNAVDKLNYAQFYPIVIFTRTENKQVIKDCRSGVPNKTSSSKREWPWKAHLSSKKLLEQCQKLEKLWGHIFTATLDLSSDSWYNQVIDLIEKQQTAPIWMSESKPEESFSDDFLFPMSTSRLSYASSPESDGEFCDNDVSSSATLRANHRTNDVHVTALSSSSDAAKTTAVSNSNSISSTINGGGASNGNGNGSNLPRSTSDPSLARQEAAAAAAAASGNSAMKTEDAIPDYNAPPPYAIKDDHRNSLHSDASKYGFTGAGSASSKAPPTSSSSNTFSESVDDLPLPPPPNANSSCGIYDDSNGSASAGAGNGGGADSGKKRSKSGLPPPKIDRQKKPSRRSTSEKYLHGHHNGGSDAMYTTCSNSLDRHAHLGDMKMSAYDPSGAEMSNSNDRPRSIGDSSAHGTPEGSNGVGGSSRRAMSQDPASSYRSNARSNGRGTSSSSASAYASSGYASTSAGAPPQQQDGHDRYSDYKPVPPPKSASYKPVPPPKPKSYPRTQSQPPSTMEGNYMNSGPTSVLSNGGASHPHTDFLHQNNNNANKNHQPSSGSSHYGHPSYGSSSYHPTPASSGHRYEDDSNGFDSGQGSSLDRDYNGGAIYQQHQQQAPPPPSNHSKGQYYYNVPQQQQHQASSSRNDQQPPSSMSGPMPPRKNADGLDLSNREYRGSAFELYKKPLQLQQQHQSQPAYNNLPRMT